MKRRLKGVVESITAQRPGAQELKVRVQRCASAEDADVGAEPECRAALNLLSLTPPVAVGDHVLLNTVAVEMSLGTGGFDFVVAGMEEPEEDAPPPGHIIKLRYTPLQFPVLAVESPESPNHDAIKGFQSLYEMPVVCVELHSQLPAVCAAAHWALRVSGFPHEPRIAYVMTDSASLPIALSRLIPQLRSAGLISATITAGQAFGGDYEAVNIYSALAAAKAAVGADIVVVGQGPGSVGTDTALGFSGVDQGLAINAVDSLGGVAIAVPRISFTDTRRRHVGLSHHTVTVLQLVARASALLPIPRLSTEMQRAVQDALREAGLDEKHQPIIVDAAPGLEALQQYGIGVTTMGRGLARERPFFLSAAAGGLLAAQIVEAR